MSGTRSTPEECCPTVSTTGTLKSQLDKEFGQNGQQILTTYRKSRPWRFSSGSLCRDYDRARHVAWVHRNR